MPTRGVSRAEENRRIKQEALREFLSKQKLIEKVLDNVKILEDLDPKDGSKDGSKLDSVQVQRLTAANATRMKLINKYLSDEQTASLSVSGPGGGPVEMTITKHVIKSSD